MAKVSSALFRATVLSIIAVVLLVSSVVLALLGNLPLATYLAVLAACSFLLTRINQPVNIAVFMEPEAPPKEVHAYNGGTYL